MTLYLRHLTGVPCPRVPGPCEATAQHHAPTHCRPVRAITYPAAPYVPRHRGYAGVRALLLPFGKRLGPRALLVAVLAVLATTQAADARPIHDTARVHRQTTDVVERWVVDAAFVSTVEDEQLVRFTINDGSVWLSPDSSCAGPRPRGCVQAWIAAAKREATS